jgi:diguanylate cyclase (GGDEF)-like protein
MELALKGYLTVIVGDQPGRVHALEEPTMTIGRGPECAIRLEGDGVSRNHARIVRHAGMYTIEDLGSTNGTWVDGNPATAKPLQSSARIRIGTHVVVRFNLLDDEEAALQQRLYDNVIQDTLTGAYNRRFFEHSLANEVAQAKRLNTALAIILLQIDDMKRINDYYTQAGGDAFLCKVTKLIQDAARPEDLLARIAPDQFGLIVRGVPMADAVSLSEKIRGSVEHLEVLWQSGDFSMCIEQVTACLAVATFDDSLSADDLMSRAAQRLLAGREKGGNIVIEDS